MEIPGEVVTAAGILGTSLLGGISYLYQTSRAEAKELSKQVQALNDKLLLAAEAKAVQGDVLARALADLTRQLGEARSELQEFLRTTEEDDGTPSA